MAKERLAHGVALGHDDILKPSHASVEHLESGEPYADLDQEAHRRLNRKLDLHVIPFIFGIWWVGLVASSRVASIARDRPVDST